MTSHVQLTPSQIDTLFALFKEREKKEKLTVKKGLATSIFGWVLDTCASYHMTSDMGALTSLFYLGQLLYITLPDGKIVKVRQAGTVNLGHS